MQVMRTRDASHAQDRVTCCDELPPPATSHLWRRVDGVSSAADREWPRASARGAARRRIGTSTGRRAHGCQCRDRLTGASVYWQRGVTNRACTAWTVASAAGAEAHGHSRDGGCESEDQQGIEAARGRGRAGCRRGESFARGGAHTEARKQPHVEQGTCGGGRRQEGGERGRDSIARSFVVRHDRHFNEHAASTRRDGDPVGAHAYGRGKSRADAAQRCLVVVVDGTDGAERHHGLVRRLLGCGRW